MSGTGSFRLRVTKHKSVAVHQLVFDGLVNLSQLFRALQYPTEKQEALVGVFLWISIDKFPTTPIIMDWRQHPSDILQGVWIHPSVLQMLLVDLKLVCELEMEEIMHILNALMSTKAELVNDETADPEHLRTREMHQRRAAEETQKKYQEILDTKRTTAAAEVMTTLTTVVKKPACHFCHAATSADLLRCRVCEKYGHRECWDMKPDVFKAAMATAWECYEHKSCFECKKSEDDERILICDGCDRGCHMYCADPKLTKVPAGLWHCQLCKKNNKRKHPEDDTAEKPGANFHFFLTGVVDGKQKQYDGNFAVCPGDNYVNSRDAFLEEVRRAMDSMCAAVIVEKKPKLIWRPYRHLIDDAPATLPPVIPAHAPVIPAHAPVIPAPALIIPAPPLVIPAPPLVTPAPIVSLAHALVNKKIPPLRPVALRSAPASLHRVWLPVLPPLTSTLDHPVTTTTTTVRPAPTMIPPVTITAVRPASIVVPPASIAVRPPRYPVRATLTPVRLARLNKEKKYVN